MESQITKIAKKAFYTAFLVCTLFSLLLIVSCTKDEDAPEIDTDEDGVVDEIDNCPLVSNPDQKDSDGDGIGDVCEDDEDGDGVPDEEDNCPLVSNPDQEDADGDGVGDVCEGDSDGDGVADDIDNCPATENPGQEDADEDGIGDVCEEDTDGDGVVDDDDNCPEIENPDQEDSDGDGIGDACDPTTVAQDKDNIQASFDSTLDCITSFETGTAIQTVFTEFLGISNGDTLNIDWVEELLDGLSAVMPESEEDGFDIDFYEGTYTYNHGTDDWTRTEDRDAEVVVLFPSSPIETTNNSTLTIGNYSDTEVTINEDVMRLPVSVDASLVVDSKEIIALNLENVTYASNADFQIPVAIDVFIYVNPYSLSIVVENESSTEFSLNLDFSDDSDFCSMGVQAEVELATSDYSNITEQDLLEATFAFTTNDMTIQSTGGIAEILQIPDPTVSQINAFIDLEVLYKDLKIADIVVEEGVDEEITVLLKYKDDSIEDSAIYYESFIDDLESIFTSYFGD